jgi:hypothetical protein
MGRLQYKLVGKLVVPMNDLAEWAKWYASANRVIGNTKVGPIEVSTVFLGLDHGWHDKPKFFETLVFGDRDRLVKIGSRKRLFRTVLDWSRRYETWDEAEQGHKEACAWAQEQLDKLDIKFNASITGRD